MTAIPERVTGHCRMWLESPSPPHTDPPRVVRQCTECGAWCIGISKVEAVDRLADHREREHP